MNMAKRESIFFVGWLNSIPRPLALFLLCIAILAIGGLSGIGFSLGCSVNDPGDGNFAWKDGYQKASGILIAKPYPILRLRPDGMNPKARTVMLTVPGKRSIEGKYAKLLGKPVNAGGFWFKRGSINMLQIQGKIALKAPVPVEGEEIIPFVPAPPVSLGRWRLVGEICDGKCYTGAMSPGDGLAHKACANLCITSGAPPVFVSTGSVEGTEFFLMSDPDGGPLPDRFRDLTAVLVELEGEVERLDDLLIFKVDLAQAKVF